MIASKLVDEDANKVRLVSVSSAAKQLGVHPKTIRNHFNLVRIGDRALVRVEDITNKISGDQANAMA